MRPKLPVVSGKELIRVLEKLGYQAVRQKGSHVRLYHSTDTEKSPLTVPLHDELAKGTLKQVMRDADLTVERLIELL